MFFLFCRILLINLFISFYVFVSAQSLPPCSYKDELTKHQAFDNWHLSLLDPIYKLSADYAPTDLIPLSALGFDSNKEVRALLSEDLRSLQQAALNAGYPLAIQSAYRSYAYQEQTFAYWVAQEGEAEALKSSARAGHSEHQLGTALDFKSKGGPPAWEVEDWATTPTGAWLAQNAWAYGFVMSYPKNKEAMTCYIYEPWHYRYIGKDKARALKDSGLSLREWLWQFQ